MTEAVGLQGGGGNHRPVQSGRIESVVTAQHLDVDLKVAHQPFDDSGAQAILCGHGESPRNR